MDGLIVEWNGTGRNRAYHQRAKVIVENCAADADDEQSDWVGYAPSVTEGDFFNRMLLHYRLEVVKRQRGAVVIRRKSLPFSKVPECE
ncbi:hypothetical protein KIN20_031982 [Parelaphostrongylus tenuis]|uniref:Uncharacterized protein n=1 Tax=Parelaphostrongylus tenuis TaxID=148309 RepID=A0AAD5R6B1_PARTN|nr:hypothetical protein KIN20_031982 [Parelaphostrongylus tenuis]